MTQKDKKLNCLNCRIGDFKHNLCDCHNGFCAKYKGVGTEEDFFTTIEALQDDIPHGEWIKTMDGNGWDEWWVFKCPLCGATIEDKQYHSWEYNYCPNCGARMKEEVKDI